MADRYDNQTDEVIRVGGEVIAPGSHIVVGKVLPKHKRNAIRRLVEQGKLKKATRAKKEAADGANSEAG